MQQINVNDLNDLQWNDLCELVHIVAAQEAADAINNGKAFDFLMARGWSMNTILIHISEK